MVDDAGRVIDSCDLGDDPYGYAYLSALLAERATGPYSVSIAADSDQRLVPMLLAAAGWALALSDDESTDELTERFADELPDDGQSGATQRRALGLARALQAGALSAALMPVSSELTGLRPVLAAHGALSTGRHAAAVALREMLRELYPAALRAYPDPADPVALAVMDALPEPGTLASSTTGRGRDAAAAADAVAAQLAAAGVADPAAVTEAITALRVAIAETPRRGAVSKAFTAAIAETVRQAVAAVRACDAAGTVLVNALAERIAAPPAAASAPPAVASARPVTQSTTAPPPAAPAPRQASREAPAVAAPLPSPTSPQPAVAYASVAPARGAATPSDPVSPPAAPPPAPAHRVPDVPKATRPVSVPPPPPPGITPIEQPREPVPDAPGSPGDRVRVPTPRPAPDRPASDSRSGWPARPANDDWTAAFPVRRRSPDQAGRSAANGAPASPVPAPPAGPSPEHRSATGSYGGTGGYGGGSHGGTGSQGGGSHGGTGSYGGGSYGGGSYGSTGGEGYPGGGHAGAGGSAGSAGVDRSRGGVVPPWRADDLRPPEPPALRLVEPSLPEELRDGTGHPSRPEPPPLRLVEPNGNGIPRSVPPVSADEDGSLLIFAQTRSAWFDRDDGAGWNSAMDLGWEAAGLAANPTVGDRTGAGLPRRVPHANLVPGAPPKAGNRPLRVVRDPASIAEHTSGYFDGWRRGQEVGGFPVGGRQGRRSAGAWEFRRDEDRLSG